MKIPFLDLKKVNAGLQNDIERAVRSVIESGWYILGKQGELFEQECKIALVGDRDGFVTGCNSGTDALILSLLACGVGPGDEVITVSHTAIPTISAIVAVGATPVFVDIDERTWVMDVSLPDRAITERTKAVIPVHLYGNMVDVERLSRTLSNTHGKSISVIEDVAQAQGSQLSSREAGTLGRFGAFSFYPSKNIGTLGDGGAVFCRTTEDRQLLQSLRNYGQQDRYHAERKRGINSRLDEIHAAILCIKLKLLGETNLIKTNMMARYRSALAGLPLDFQHVTEQCIPAWHLCVIRLRDSDTRTALQAYLQEEGIQTLIHYPIPNHRQTAFIQALPAELPVTEHLSGRILSLPFNTAMSDDDIDYLLNKIRYYCEHHL